MRLAPTWDVGRAGEALRRVAGALLLGGCGHDAFEWEAWEEFRRTAVQYQEGGQTRYFVQQDIPIGGESELWDYYRRELQAEDDVASFRSVVNLLDDQTTRDRWSPNQSQSLSYCVSDEFDDEDWFVPGTDDPHANAISYIDRAVRQWQSFGNVHFEYLPMHDANCDHDNDGVFFSVRPWIYGGALSGCSFYPNDTINKEPCVESLGFIRTVWLGKSAVQDEDGGRIALHEIGHMLGMRHERAHEDRDPLICNPDNDGVGGQPWYRESLSESFDYRSTMLVTHQDCRASGWDYSVLSDEDRQGVGKVYGIPISWYVAIGVV